MFRKSYNRAVLGVRIDTVTPLRIGAGGLGLDPSAADLTCVRTHHGAHGSTVYIPGSSFKGVIRAAAEASVRGRQATGGVVGACEDPLDTRDPEKSCGAKAERIKPSHAVYKSHCLACRLFGSQAMQGRASVRDLFPWSDEPGADARLVADGHNHTTANRLELRHGVSICRMLGSVRQGPFEQELVPAGASFFGDIALENYQVWQLGLLAEAFEQLNLGIGQLGSSKSRGLGVVTVHVERLVHEQAGGRAAPCGVGDLATAEERSAYGLLHESTLPAVEGVARGLATRFDVRREPYTWLTAGQAALGALL